MIRKIIIFLVIIFLVIVSSCSQQHMENFSDIKTLSSSKYASWIPNIIPKEAKNIMISTHVETDRMWMIFSLSQKDQDKIDGIKLVWQIKKL